VTGAFTAGLADLVAAVWIWALLSVAAIAAGIGLFVWGYQLGRHNRGRAVVLAAMEAVASETITLPRQRHGSEL
jgi:hypothetical protein